MLNDSISLALALSIVVVVATRELEINVLNFEKPIFSCIYYAILPCVGVNDERKEHSAKLFEVISHAR